MALDDENSILSEITSNAMEPDYRNHRPRRRQISLRHRITAAGGLVVVGFLVAGTISLGVTNRHRETSLVKATKKELISQVEKALILRDLLNREVAALSMRIDRTQRENLNLTTIGSELAARIDHDVIFAGEKGVSGPGVIVRLDSTSLRTPIFDADLQRITNGLWAAGAEAIAISGIRLTATSAIRHAGEAILVDYRPISPPYSISAIGDAIRIRAELKSGELARLTAKLKSSYGINTSVIPKRQISLPGHSAVQLRYASRVPS